MPTFLSYSPANQPLNPWLIVSVALLGPPSRSNKTTDTHRDAHRRMRAPSSTVRLLLCLMGMSRTHALPSTFLVPEAMTKLDKETGAAVQEMTKKLAEAKAAQKKLEAELEELKQQKSTAPAEIYRLEGDVLVRMEQEPLTPPPRPDDKTSLAARTKPMLNQMEAMDDEDVESAKSAMGVINGLMGNGFLPTDAAELHDWKVRAAGQERAREQARERQAARALRVGAARTRADHPASCPPPTRAGPQPRHHVRLRQRPVRVHHQPRGRGVGDRTQRVRSADGGGEGLARHDGAGEPLRDGAGGRRDVWLPW